MYPDNNFETIEKYLADAQNAFLIYKQTPLFKRIEFLKAIAQEIENKGDDLIQIAKKETNLSEQRLIGERKRTVSQLINYADSLLNGNILDVKIDFQVSDNDVPSTNLRKMMVPIGPVVVFGSSNFPFAYSTAGGDTACALAAGCPVIVKAHPAHIEASTMVADAIFIAAKKCNLPDGIFTHVYGADNKVGEFLVMHPIVKAVAFTGSLTGGRALFDLAAQRTNPIPVFAEMGSVNPVFLLPNKLATDAEWLASKLMHSITQDMGQFCTNPGLLVALKGDNLEKFENLLLKELHKVSPSEMLNQGIANNYIQKMQTVITQRHVEVLYQSENIIHGAVGMITLAKIPARYFLSNSKTHQEVFGPFSMIIECNDEEQMLEVAQKLEGQLTTTLMATTEDLSNSKSLILALEEKCGRFNLNNVPTGVKVSWAMQHGGPYPSTTDSRFTSVGADGIKRFLRPFTYQNWNDEMLPDALKDANPLNIWRTINNELTKAKIV